MLFQTCFLGSSGLLIDVLHVGMRALSGSSCLVRSGSGSLVRSGSGSLVRSGSGRLIRSGSGRLVRSGSGRLVAAAYDGDVSSVGGVGDTILGVLLSGEPELILIEGYGQSTGRIIVNRAVEYRKKGIAGIGVITGIGVTVDVTLLSVDSISAFADRCCHVRVLVCRNYS